MGVRRGRQVSLLAECCITCSDGGYLAVSHDSHHASSMSWASVGGVSRSSTLWMSADQLLQLLQVAVCREAGRCREVDIHEFLDDFGLSLGIHLADPGNDQHLIHVDGVGVVPTIDDLVNVGDSLSFAGKEYADDEGR